MREITPAKSRCVLGACPRVYVDDEGSAFVVGTAVAADHRMSNLHLGAGEAIVRLPEEILRNLQP